MSLYDQKSLYSPDNNLIRILISAYACHPDQVSEPGVAWMQVRSLVMTSRYDITILTRKKNVQPLIASLNSIGGKNFSVIGVDLPSWSRLWKIGHLTLHIYYYIWQLLAYFVATKLDKIFPFDVAHHISFMSLRTNMVPFLRPPSVVGPVGGAQIPPTCFGKVLRHPVKEQLRTVSIVLMKYSPLFRRFLSKVDVLLLANKENFWVIPKKNRNKCFIRQIGWKVPQSNLNCVKLVNSDKKTNLLNIYWSGRLIGWKGLEILLRALPLLKDDGLNFIVNISGKGEDECFFKSLVSELDLDSEVVFHGFLKKNKMLELQELSDVYVFTSLHETTGTALFEMMALGKALVVIDHAGPGEIIEKGGALKISTKNGVDKAIKQCADNILRLSRSHYVRMKLGNEAIKNLKLLYGWDDYIKYVENIYIRLATDRKFN